MTDAADALDVRDVRLTAPPGTDGPATEIASVVPADARSRLPESPEARQLLRDLVLRALL